MSITTAEFTSHTAATGYAASAMAAVRNLGTAMRAARARRRFARQSAISLRSLDTRALADIGISRSEITSIVYSETQDRRRNHEHG